ENELLVAVVPQVDNAGPGRQEPSALYACCRHIRRAGGGHGRPIGARTCVGCAATVVAPAAPTLRGFHTGGSSTVSNRVAGRGAGGWWRPHCGTGPPAVGPGCRRPPVPRWGGRRAVRRLPCQVAA